MTYDKSRVYTALNADKLKIGSRVIVADSITELKFKVKKGDVVELSRIYNEGNEHRFEVEDGLTKNNIPIVTYWGLAYLVSEPKEKILQWIDLELGDKIKCFSGEHYGNKGIVTYIDTNPNCSVHILVGSCWLSDVELKDWEKVECALNQ